MSEEWDKIEQFKHDLDAIGYLGFKWASPQEKWQAILVARREQAILWEGDKLLKEALDETD